MIKVTINYNKFVAIGAAEEPKINEEFFLEDNDYEGVYNVITSNDKEKIASINIDYNVTEND